MKQSQVKLVPAVNDKLDKLARKRQKEGSAVRTKQGIVEHLIDAAYAKEIGKYTK